MGCTSGKEIKKRTTSLEDVSQKKEAPPKTAVPPNENGQITATKNRPNESTPTPANNVIQIAGANKSFLAPDGIPFIDEDSEEEVEEKATAVQQHQSSPHETLPTLPDQNKNFISKKPDVTAATPHQPTLESYPSALRESSPSAGGTNVEESRREGLPAPHEEQPAVVGEILELELRQSSANTTSAAFGRVFFLYLNNLD